MEADLKLLESWFHQHGTTLDLADPAPPSAIAAAEEELGFTLPADLRAFYALHDGQRSEKVSWLPGGGHLHGIADCVKNWKDQQEYVEPGDEPGLEDGEDHFFQVVFHPRRLAIGGVEHWDGDNFVLDMVPGPEGREGQILGFTSECDMVLLGHGFAGFLARYVKLIEAGALACIPVEGQEYDFNVVPADYKTRSFRRARWDDLFDPRKAVKKPRKKK